MCEEVFCPRSQVGWSSTHDYSSRSRPKKPVRCPCGSRIHAPESPALLKSLLYPPRTAHSSEVVQIFFSFGIWLKAPESRVLTIRRLVRSFTSPLSLQKLRGQLLLQVGLRYHSSITCNHSMSRPALQTLWRVHRNIEPARRINRTIFPSM